MNEPIAITCLMPAYNAEKYIAEAIESILAQSFTDFELMIIDDASTDATLAIAEHYQKRDPRIVILKNEKNFGIAISSNIGLEKARGKYIAKMDADDVSFPDRFMMQYQFMEQNPKVCLVGASIEVCDATLKSIGKRSYRQGDKEIRKKLFRFSPFAHPVCFYRTELAKRVGGYSFIFPVAIDYDFYFKIGKFGEFANLPATLLKLRTHPGSISQTRARQQQELTLYIRFKAVVEYGYSITFMDKIYTIIQWFGIKVFPTDWIFSIFHFVRRFL